MSENITHWQADNGESIITTDTKPGDEFKPFTHVVSVFIRSGEQWEGVPTSHEFVNGEDAARSLAKEEAKWESCKEVRILEWGSAKQTFIPGDFS